jgi:hypothetical protein
VGRKEGYEDLSGSSGAKMETVGFSSQARKLVNLAGAIITRKCAKSHKFSSF